MQVLFRLGRLRWDTLCTLCFIFMTEKENNFQTDQNIALLHLKSKEKSLILSKLTQVFFVLLSLLSKHF